MKDAVKIPDQARVPRQWLAHPTIAERLACYNGLQSRAVSVAMRSQPDELNAFYGHFEPKVSGRTSAAWGVSVCVPTIIVADANQIGLPMNGWKATVQNGVPDRVPRTCME